MFRTTLRTIAWTALLLSVAACSPPAESPAPAEAAPPAPAATEPGVLETPYTAEQIRDAWGEGLELRMTNKTGDYPRQYQRWTVVAADAEGADIEYIETDADGKPIGPPQVRRSLWVELRDHARFPSDRCTRVEETRETPLGEYAGWVYTLNDEAAGAQTEFFFAHDLPGAPVTMVVRRGGEVVQEMRQIARTPSS